MSATELPSQPTAPPAKWPWVSLAFLAAVIFLYLVALRGLKPIAGGTQGPGVGQTLPYLRLESLTGGDQRWVSLDDLKGRVSLINYWGTWCPPCRREFPGIVHLAEHFAKDEAFRLYAVSCGEEGDDADVAPLKDETLAFLKAYQASLPTFSDQHKASRRALAMLFAPEPFGYPVTIVVDQQGVIRGSWIGFEQGAVEEMHDLVHKLLHKPDDVPDEKTPAA